MRPTPGFWLCSFGTLPRSKMKYLPAILAGLLTLIFPLALMADAQTDGVEMSILPSGGSFQTGNEFTTQVHLNSNGLNFVTAEARVRYDPSRLKVVAVEDGSLSGQYASVVREDKGTVAIILMRISETTWDDTLASIRFRSIQSGTTSVDLVYDVTGTSEDSGVYSLSSGDDLLGKVSGANYNLTGDDLPVATPTPVLPATPQSSPTLQPQMEQEISQQLSQATALPNTGFPQMSYTIVGIASFLLLAGARLVIVRA